MCTSSRLGLSATKSMCLGLGLGVSALDRILKDRILNKDRIESSTKIESNVVYERYKTSRDVCFRSKM